MAAITWDEFIRTQQYKDLADDEQREDVRNQYFNSVIAPTIPKEHINTAFEQFSKHAIQTENTYRIDEDIARLETVPENEGFIDELKREAGLKQLKRLKELNNPQTTFDKYAASLAKGMEGSALVKVFDTYVNETPDYQKISYEPDSTAQSIVQGLGTIAADLPMFGAGKVITTGGAIAKTAGSFALPAAIGNMVDIRKENGEVGLSDIPRIAGEAAIGGLEGAAFGAAGIPGQILQRVVKSPVKAALAGLGSDLALESGVMLTAEALKGNEITGKTLGETIGTIAAMKLIHANPYIKRALNSKSEATGLPVEKLAENLDADQAKIIRDAETANKAAEYSALKTETQIKQEYTQKVQREVIDDQIRRNYKDGKAPEEIIKLEQIPEEYLPHVADMVDGQAVIKPEIIQKVDSIINRKDPITSQMYEDVLPGMMRDIIQADRQGLVREHGKTTSDLENAKTYLQAWEEYEPQARQNYINEELNKLAGDYRHFTGERYARIREKMDEVIDHTLSITTPEEQFKIALDPSKLTEHIDMYESGYSQLKKPYQEAVKKEIVAQIIQRTNMTPAHIMDAALKKADYKVKQESQPYMNEVKTLETKLARIEKNPEFHRQLQQTAEKTDGEIKQELEERLKTSESVYQKELEANQTNFMRAMGTSAVYGDMALNSKEIYGRQYNDRLEWAKKPVADIRRVFEKAAFVTYKPHEEHEGVVKINSKISLENKFRFIKMRLGEEAYKEFYEPWRDAVHTLTMERKHYKDILKDRSNEWTKKERQQLGLYAESLQYSAQEALKKMGVEPPVWDDLSPKQRAMYDEGRRITDLMLDRVNVVRAAAGLDPLRKVENYFTLIRKFEFMERMGYNPHTISNTNFEAIKVHDAKMNALSYAYGKERVSSKRELETDYFAVLDRYLYSTLSTIHLTPYISKMREAINSEKFRVTNPKAYAYMDMALNEMAGKKISEASEALNYAATVAHRNLTGATLCLNVGTGIKQFSAPTMAIPEIGPLYLAKGIKDMQSDVMRKFAEKESSVLSSRVMDVTFDHLKDSVTGKVSAAQVWATEKGMLHIKYADKISTQTVWLGGYRYAKDVLNLNHRGCARYADDLIVRTQGSADRADIAPIQHTPIGKFFTTFGTYSINQFGYIKDEIFGLGKRNNLVAEGISEKEADAKYKAEGFIRKPVGKNKYNIYEPERFVNRKDSFKKGIELAVIMGLVSTGYELLDGAIPDFINLDSPNPAPVSAFIEGMTGQEWVDMIYGKDPSTREVQLIDGLFNDPFVKGLVSATAETAMFLPISGGSLKYGGGNLFGAGGSYLVDLLNALSGQNGAKPMQLMIGKLAGIPGTTQAVKILRQLQKERIADEKQRRRDADPIGTMKREMYRDSPFHRQNTRYKDPGLVEGLFQ